MHFYHLLIREKKNLQYIHAYEQAWCLKYIPKCHNTGKHPINLCEFVWLGSYVQWKLSKQQ